MLTTIAIAVSLASLAVSLWSYRNTRIAAAAWREVDHLRRERETDRG